MHKEVSQSVQLLLKVREVKLYDKLVLQLQKDFGLVNIAIQIPQEVSPNQLETLLREKMYYLLMERFSDYLNLLYVVDIPESVFKKIAATNAVDVAHEITFFILERAFKKVRLKQKYSS